MQSKAKVVKEYLDGLDLERKEIFTAVRKIIRANLPDGIEESIQYSMITYVVPLSRYPKGYGGKKDVSLPFISLAAQKNYFALYMMNLYGDEKSREWFEKEYKKTGKKFDMGKSCLRFKKLEDLPLPLIAKAVSRVSMDKFIKNYEKARARTVKK